MSAAGGARPEISLVIIDSQHVVHAGIEAWLSGTQPPIKIVGNYAYPAEFMSVDPAATSHVDVVLFALQYDDGPEFGYLPARTTTPDANGDMRILFRNNEEWLVKAGATAGHRTGLLWSP